MKITVVGTGYVGLVTGTCFAEVGNSVTCVDIDAAKVKELKRGAIPIYEPHLEGLFQRNIKEGRLSFTTRLASAVASADVIFLALPTPPGQDGAADLSHVLGVAEQLGHLIKRYTVVVNKSTVPVSTAEKVKATIAQNYHGRFDVVSNPEFLREGFAVDDFMKPDRVVIGSSSARANKVMERLYAPFIRQGNPIYFMDERSAEVTKYAANAFLATKISFMNEVANIAERAGANIDDIRIAIGADDRIGRRFLFAGIGYGGSCFPKDVQALNQTALACDYDFAILRAVMSVNDRQWRLLVEKITDHFGGNVAGKTLALWGLAFKPDTDDIRESRALYLIEQLSRAGVKIVAYDPQAMDNVAKLMGDRLTFAKNQYEACRGADALVIVTEWAEFRTPNFARLEKLLKAKTIFDGRNLYSLDQMKELGFYYLSVGRPVVGQPVPTSAQRPSASRTKTRVS